MQETVTLVWAETGYHEGKQERVIRVYRDPEAASKFVAEVTLELLRLGINDTQEPVRGRDRREANATFPSNHAVKSADTKARTNMGWRKLKVEDLCLGLSLRLTNMADSAYNGCTVIAFTDGGDNGPGEGLVKLARPMAYADADCNSSQAMLYAEVFSVQADRLTGIAEVWEGRDGKLRTHATKAA